MRRYHYKIEPVPYCKCWLLPSKFDPKWGSWSGSCEVTELTCSNVPVERKRERKCENNICLKKHYYQVEFEPCTNILPCRKLCWIFLDNNFYQAYWSEWEDDENSMCSVSCGSGFKRQTRHCRRGNKRVGDAACEGSLRGIRDTICNHQRCRKLKLDFISIRSLKLIITQQNINMHIQMPVLAYWSQDSSNACNMIRDTGYTSWSLSCQNKHDLKTSCSTLIASVQDKDVDVRWTNAAKYVPINELKIQNYAPIIKETVDENAFEAMTEIQNFSEIKEGVLSLVETGSQSVAQIAIEALVA